MTPLINSDYNKFVKLIMNTLDKQIPNKKKHIRDSETAYMTKQFKKHIMHRTKLRNKFLKKAPKENEIKFKK